MQLINQEARQNQRIPLNIDFFSMRYKTSNDLYTFSSPSLWTIEKNLYYLLKNSDEIPFDSKYKYKPSYLSYYMYQTIILDGLLMYVNNVFCAEDFDLSTVIVPSLSSIIDICNDKFSKKSIDRLEAVAW